MKVSFSLFERQKQSFSQAFKILVLLGNLIVLFLPISSRAAGNNCNISGPASAAYTVTVCITEPSDGVSTSGLQTVLTTVTTSGVTPGVAKLIFYLNGQYLLTDFQTPYTFVLPTYKWVDASYTLEVEALMKDGFTSQRASIMLTFNNGIVQPPVNNNVFTPSNGTTPPSGQPFVLAATGDGASGEMAAGDVTDLIASWNPNLFLYLGDVYENGTSTEFYNWYGTESTFYGRFRSITNPVIGNHEYQSGGIAPGYFDYWDNIPRYYSYNAAGWHFIALDSNCGLVPSCAVGQAQYQWLLNDLSTHTNVCTIAYFHHPVYNVGPEGYTTSINALWALMAQYGVDIVLTGHDHDYQRWMPLDENGNPSATGITEFVAGTGGHGIQHFITTDSRLVVGYDDTSPNSFGALRLQLNQQGAGYQYINTSGVVLDSGSIGCSGTPPDTTPPSRPTNLIATSNSSHLVKLTWTASTDNVGVVEYDIFRNGSLLTTIPFLSSYEDTAVAPDTSYTYRIRARDAAGNMSTQSNTTSVITPSLLFSDGFESGSLAQWTDVHNLVVQQQQVYAGQYAVRGTSNGIPTYAYRQLSQERSELYYRLWFKILSQSVNSIYLQRFRTSSTSSIMGVYISSTGKLGYRNDVTGASVTSTTMVTSGIWHELQARIRINGNAGETEVWIDGVRVDSLSNTEYLGNTLIGLVQLGEASSGRSYDIALDQVALSTNYIDSANPPKDTIPPVVTYIVRADTSPTSTANVNFTVTFSEAVMGVDASDFSLTSSGVTGASVSSVVDTGDQTVYIVTVDTGRGNGTIRLDLKGSGTGIRDLAGNNLIGGFTGGEKYIINKIPGAGVYEDTDANWSYTSGWLTYNGPEYTDNSLHYTSTVGDRAMFTFSGTQFILTYTQAPNRGDIQVYVDGTQVATIDATGVLQWQKTYTSPVYPSGTHVVEFEHAGGSYIDVDRLEILNTTAPGVGVYEDTDANWSYTSGWLTYSGPEYTDNSLHYTSTVGDRASFTFSGTQFILTYTQAPNRGDIQVYVDGTQVATIDATGVLQWQKTYTSPVYPSGTHVVKFKHAGGNGAYIDVDRLQIQ